MKTNYILTHRWYVKLNGLTGMPRINCLVDHDWPNSVTYKEQQDGFEVAGPLDQIRDTRWAVKLAKHIAELHNASLRA